MARLSRVLYALLSLLFFSGCGKYASPVPPELAAPKAIEYSKVEVVGDSLTIQWSSPSEDRRGEELGSLAGYSVQGRSTSKIVEVGDESLAFKEIIFVPDLSIESRETARAKARSEGRPARREKGEETLRSHTLTLKIDQLQIPGLLRIVPINYYGEGESTKVIRIAKNGVVATATIFPMAALLDEEESFDAFDSSGDE